MYKLSNKSLEKLKGVHPKLVQVVKRAIEITDKDFSVTYGIRTKEAQHKLVLSGKSQTLNSKHLVQSDGYGHAVDLAPYPLNWDLDSFYPIAEAMQKASKELNIPIRWGGAWVTLTKTDKSPYSLIQAYSKKRKKQGRKVFIDAPHFELIGV